MTKTQGRRFERVAQTLTTRERLPAVLDAMADDKQEVISTLYRTAPVYSYSATDQKLCNAVDAAEAFGLRVDRTFYHSYVRYWRAIAFLDAADWQDAEPEPPERKEHPLSALADVMIYVRALQILANRLGLELRQLLASLLCPRRSLANFCDFRFQLAFDVLQSAY